MNPIPFLLESTLGLMFCSKIYGGFAVKPSLRLHCILSEDIIEHKISDSSTTNNNEFRNVRRIKNGTCCSSNTQSSKKRKCNESAILVRLSLRRTVSRKSISLLLRRFTHQPGNTFTLPTGKSIEDALKRLHMIRHVDVLL